MYIEGKNATLEALKSGTTINKILVQSDQQKACSQIVALAKQAKVRVDFVDKRVLDSKSQTKRHQGVLAETTEYEYSSLDDIFEKAEKQGQAPFIVILDGIEDPHNVGAIIRTCECVGVHGIIIPQYRACLINETVIKTSAGATANMNVCKVTNINQTIDELKSRGVWVYGLELGGNDIYKTNLTGSVALVIGSEGKGVSELTKKKCDEIVSLPMYGKINSLNASVATAVAVYEIKKQRNGL
ncbi:MAG: 23S rRNA (guanosine(2251)-2'-O)-methyltransferase RlmB [Clostridia bacterium]|nr:23S rRNA (guanosine(2251)-2'-O)-methyltransferase RlmB [Clostridia bacterium]